MIVEWKNQQGDKHKISHIPQQNLNSDSAEALMSESTEPIQPARGSKVIRWDPTSNNKTKADQQLVEVRTAGLTTDEEKRVKKFEDMISEFLGILVNSGKGF